MRLPNGWKKVELDEIFDFQKKSKIKAGEGLNEGKYRFFTSSDKQSKFLDRYEMDGEYLIFATGGHAGIHYCNERFSTSTDCFVVKVKSKILTKYIYYYLFSKIHILESGFKGSGLKHISKEYTKKIKIFYPENKETQKKIISIIEKAEKAKELRKEADELTKNFLKAVFLEMFEDPGKNEKKFNIVSLGDILIESPQNGLYKHSSEYTRRENGTPIIRIDSFYDGKLNNISNLKRLKCNQKEQKLFSLENRNIVVNRVNSLEYLGKCALIEELKETTVFESNMMRLRVNEEIMNSRFLTFLLCTAYLKSQILSKAKKAVNQASINQEDVQSLKIIAPPIELQNKFDNIIREIERLQENQDKSRDQISELFNNLMQKAFKGELAC